MTDIMELDDYTGHDEWHAVYTIQLSELIKSGVFDWARPELDWSEAAYSAEQYKRVCDYFIARFKWREISMLTILQWFDTLKYKLIYELSPKYNELYKVLENEINILADSDEYYKERVIGSDYPETMLSGNSDYASSGTDKEGETVRLGNIINATERFQLAWHGIDELMVDNLESMFIGAYTLNVNGW